VVSGSGGNAFWRFTALSPDFVHGHFSPPK